MDFVEWILMSGAPLMAAGACFIGVIACARPVWMSRQYGIAADWPNAGFVVALGVRDLFMGAAMFFAWWHQSWVTVAVFSTLLAGVAVVDFAIVLKLGEKKASLVHLMGALACTVYAVAVFALADKMAGS